MSPRTGRPKSDNPKNVRLEIRLTQEQSNSLDECAKILGTNRTDAIIKGIELLREQIKQK